MPLFRRTDPDTDELISYIVARALARATTLNRTKLVKLLYLVDIDRVRSRRAALTGYEWVFFHYGPYAFELVDQLEAMERRQLVVERWHDSILYRAARDAPDGSEWPPATKLTVDHVVDRFAPLELNELLDYVYFHTGPMVHARRGHKLDLTLALNDRTRPSAALKPHAPPTDVADRLANWRSRTARRLAPAHLDPPGSVLRPEESGLEMEGVRGRLRVSEDNDR